jgi:hypothetical protein
LLGLADADVDMIRNFGTVIDEDALRTLVLSLRDALPPDPAPAGREAGWIPLSAVPANTANQKVVSGR